MQTSRSNLKNGITHMNEACVLQLHDIHITVNSVIEWFNHYMYLDLDNYKKLITIILSSLELPC